MYWLFKTTPVLAACGTLAYYLIYVPEVLRAICLFSQALSLCSSSNYRRWSTSN
jgi:hypothetical protein